MPTSTNPQRRQNNPDDPVGYEIAVRDACVIYGGGGDEAAKTLIPDNDEYEFAGIRDNCNYCINCMPRQFDSSSGCEYDPCPDGSHDVAGTCWTNNFPWYVTKNIGDRNGKCASSGGGIPFYKRRGYLAPKDDCCFNPGTKTIGNKTCDPKYRSGPYSADCNDTYLNKCNNSSQVFTQKCIDFCDSGRADKCKNILNNFCSGQMLADGNQTCTNWCEKNPELCATRIREYCVDSNLDKQFCKDKLIKIGYSDNAVNDWCSSHPNDPFCACNKALKDSDKISEPAVKAVLSRPECYVAECSSGAGYKYTNMRQSTSCPPVNVCVNKITVAGNEYANLQNVKQECNQSIKVNQPSEQSQQPTQQPTQFTQTQTPTSDNISIGDNSPTSNDVNYTEHNGKQIKGPMSELTLRISNAIGFDLDFMGEYTAEILIGLLALIFVLLLIMAVSGDDPVKKHIKHKIKINNDLNDDL
jgi:hypothetical protein